MPDSVMGRSCAGVGKEGEGMPDAVIRRLCAGVEKEGERCAGVIRGRGGNAKGGEGILFRRGGKGQPMHGITLSK